MELGFIWVDKFRNIDNQSFNISSQYLFKYDHQSNYLGIENNPNFIPDFFEEGISNVTGIIGQNASGKTNLLELINYCLNEGNTKINSQFLVVYFHRGDENFTVVCNRVDKPKSNKDISFENYKPKNGYFDSIFLSNVFDGRRHDLSKETIDRTTNSFFENQFGENFLTNYRDDIQSQINFINSQEYEKLNKIEKEFNPNSQTDFKPTHAILTSPTWGNIRSRANAFDRQSSDILEKDISYLKDFCLAVRNKITKSQSDERSILYYTSFLLLVDFLVNEFIALNKNRNDESERKKELTDFLNVVQLQEMTTMPINKIHDNITGKIAQFIDAEFPHNFERFRFLHDLGYEKFAGLVDKEFEGTYSNRKVTFSMVYSDAAASFIRNYLKATTNLSLTYNIDWQGISSGHKAYLGIFSRLYSAREELKKNNVIICIDEGDLYFHPKWQTEFLYKLIKTLPILFNPRSVQVILTTHSPFLVSDLTKSHLIFLRKNSETNLSEIVPSDKIDGETFGGNIGELYLDAFFLKGSLMSHFATTKLKPLIQRVKDNQLRVEDRILIRQIGESLIKNFVQQKMNND